MELSHTCSISIHSRHVQLHHVTKFPNAMRRRHTSDPPFPPSQIIGVLVAMSYLRIQSILEPSVQFTWCIHKKLVVACYRLIFNLPSFGNLNWYQPGRFLPGKENFLMLFKCWTPKQTFINQSTDRNKRISSFDWQEYPKLNFR